MTSKTRLVDGKLKLSFDSSGLKKLSFREHGIMEEGLLLVFQQKRASARTCLRIRGMASEFDHLLASYSAMPTLTELIPKLEQAMGRLCSRIGLLENLATNRGENSEIGNVARHALETIREYCGNTEFSGRANEILDRITPKVEQQQISYGFERCSRCGYDGRDHSLDRF